MEYTLETEPDENKFGETHDVYFDPVVNHLYVIQDNVVTPTGNITCSVVKLNEIMFSSIDYQLITNQADVTPARLADLRKQNIKISFVDNARVD